MTRARVRPLVARATAALATAALAGCPAPSIPLDADDFEVTPFDATAMDPPGQLIAGAPSCSPETLIDIDRGGTHVGNTFVLDVDSRSGRNDLHPTCADQDSTEVVLRYHTPPLADRVVRAFRVTTITDETVANATVGEDGALGGDGVVQDPTDYDTVLSLRLDCVGSDVGCDNDAFVADPTGRSRPTRRSTVYSVDTDPEDVFFIVVDGYAGSAGHARVTLTEYPQLGVVNAPCVPIPRQRIMDPTAQQAYFRCPHPGILCQPGAAPDGTDLCLPIVPIGAPCDPDQHFNLCDRLAEGAECVTNPSMQDEIQCAMPGTAPGARCRGLRGMPNRCDAGMVCSEGTLADDRDTCVPLRHLGETCDPSPTLFINQCEAGLVCCADAPDAGTTTYCQPAGTTPCYTPMN